MTQCIRYSPEDLELATESLYALVLSDDDLSPFFAGFDVNAIEQRQRQFLLYVIDPEHYPAGQNVDLRKAHAPLVEKGLNHQHFDLLVGYLKTALEETAISAADREVICQRVEATRSLVLGEGMTTTRFEKEKTMLGRTIAMIYAVTCYAIGMAVLAYSAAWLIGIYVPNPLDGPPTGNFAVGVVLNIGLVLLFALQHSVMARPWFKQWWTKIIPPESERATYILASSIAMFAMMWFWQPLGVTIWSLSGTAATVAYAIYGLGWFILVSATFCLDHFDLFGLRQAWLNLRGKAYTHLPFGRPFYYKVVRHPIYVGWIVLIWATPMMTVSHLVFALATTAYILVAIPIEERDLEEMLPDYAQYKASTPALVPRFGSRGEAITETR